MNGIDRISERILNDAQAEAAHIIEEAQERARSLKEDRTGQVEKENERYYQETIERARERKRRMLAMAGLEMRKRFWPPNRSSLTMSWKRPRRPL